MSLYSERGSDIIACFVLGQEGGCLMFRRNIPPLGFFGVLLVLEMHRLHGGHSVLTDHQESRPALAPNLVHAPSDPYLIHPSVDHFATIQDTMRCDAVQCGDVGMKPHAR